MGEIGWTGFSEVSLHMDRRNHGKKYNSEMDQLHLTVKVKSPTRSEGRISVAREHLGS